MKRWLIPLVMLMMHSEPTSPCVFADEGMWLFNNPPRKLLKEKYEFDATEKWLEHVQKSSVRFNSGGSGSFVSADGLVMTNHHVGLGALQKLSKKGKDFVRDGFYAKSLGEEFQSVDEELVVLMDITDVTDQVKAAVKPDMPADKAFEARRAVIAQIEAESEKKTGLHSNVVTLYQGGMFHLYRYKRYTDVRLVFAPEQQIAFYGGDADNFAYPRYDLDVCFFRVYEEGKPAKIEHHLTWSQAGLKDGELVFVSGHPGKTDRLNTVAELEYLRDIGYPFLMQRLNRLEVMLSIYSGRGEEYERKAKDLLFGVANSRKARDGGLAGLQDPAMMAQKKANEKSMRAAIAINSELKDVAQAFDVIEKVQKVRANVIKRYTLIEGGAGFNTGLFGIARALVRAADEYAKPDDQRLSEFNESNKKSLELKLFSRRPIYEDFELAKLQDSMMWLCEILGQENPIVQKALAGKSPRARATELISGTKLMDVEARKKLYQGGKSAVTESKDTMILLSRAIDKESRELRKIIESQLEEPKQQAYDKIAKAKFVLEGTNTYPDATFSLRLSFGTVKGYEEDGKKIPYETTFAGLYETAKEHNNKYPFNLPERWFERKDKLNLKTPFNFVCTADIIGGNSGSPVVNRKGEVVGLIFDGNIQSLVWDFAFTDEQARAVSVCTGAITEALRAVYDAGPLADEIIGGNRK
ncbi:MAG: S46 family peptidase [Planctomycetes bacterium]|nr:S46 family peptidase [Planctomycetota bacterium]